MTVDKYDEFVKKVFSENFSGEPDEVTSQILYQAYNENGFKPDFGLDQGYLHIGGLTEDNLENNGPSSAKLLDLARVILCSYALSLTFDKSEFNRIAADRLKSIAFELSTIEPDVDGYPSGDWLGNIYSMEKIRELSLKSIRERNDWKRWPDIRPYPFIVMEIRFDGDDDHQLGFFDGNSWHIVGDKACHEVANSKFQYRPANARLEEQKDQEKAEGKKITEYNPYAWNDFPEVTPPYNAIMRLEFEDATTNRKYYYAAFYTSEGWRQAVENRLPKFVLNKAMIEAGLIKNARFHIWDY